MPDEPGNLPAVPPPAGVAGVVIDGQIVDGPGRSRTLIPAPVRVVAGHPAAALAGRHLKYVAAGVHVAVKRRHLRRTMHQRMARSAEATGNHEVALKWIQQEEDERNARTERWRHRAEVARAVAPLVPWALLAAAVAPGLLGIALAYDHKNLVAVTWPYLWTMHAIGTAWEVASAAWSVATFAVPLAVIARLYHLGRTDSMAPGWVATSADPDVDVEITELTITQAVKNLRIPQVRDYLNDGLPLQFLVSCRQEGRGTYFEVRLPGVAAEKIVRRRTDFAAGLYRLPKEVWPSTGSEAAILRGWIADKGALEEGAGPYPLLEEGFADVFQGLPFGRTLRGDLVRIPVIGRNSICGGMPEQGKSNSARVVAGGYTLDVITEMRIWVPDTNFDFEYFEPRCSEYVMGADDEHIGRIVGSLEVLKDELQRRGQLLIDYEQQEVTRELAHAGVGLHPLFCLLEEAHIVIQHHKHGKDASRLLCDIVKLDRKRGVHFMVSTQAPVRGSMPRDVTTNCTIGIAHALSDIWANDAILGPGAHSAGHRATELMPTVDRGTALCKGFGSEARSEMVQVHRVDAKRDRDQVTPLVSRALAEMARLGREVPGTGLPVLESRDLLADLAAVTRLDSGRVNVADLPARLRDLAKAWGPYKRLNGVQLADLLRVEGVRVYTTGGTLRVDPADLAAAATRPTDATLAGQGPVGELED